MDSGIKHRLEDSHIEAVKAKKLIKQRYPQITFICAIRVVLGLSATTNEHFTSS